MAQKKKKRNRIYKIYPVAPSLLIYFMFLDCFQSLGQIRDQILFILQTTGYTD